MSRDIDGKSSRRRYYGKIGALVKQGVDRNEANRRARGYAGGKTSPRAGRTAEAEANDGGSIALPYATPSELPETVRSALPREAQEIFIAAFNSAYDESGGDEETSMETAWAAVKRAGYEKREDGAWVQASEDMSYRGLIQMDDWYTGMPESGPLVSEIQIARLGSWDHPQYGRFAFTDETLQQFVDNFYANVRGVDLAVDAAHEPDKGAVGWFKDLFKRGQELWARVEWTDAGAGLLRDGTYRYFSPEFVFAHTDPESGAKIKNVLQGGALTNRPFIKGMAPVMLSEDLLGELVCWPVADEDDSDAGDVSGDKEKDVVALNEQTRKALKLSEDATPEQIGEAVEAFLAEQSDQEAEAKKLAEENDTLAGQVKSLNERVAASETAVKTAEWERYRDGKIREGHLTMALSEKFAPLYMQDAESAKGIIDALPKQVDLSEKGTSGTGGGENSADDSPDTMFLAEVSKYQQEHEVDFVRAMSEVTKLKPDLATAYHEHSRGQAVRR